MEISRNLRAVSHTTPSSYSLVRVHFTEELSSAPSSDSQACTECSTEFQRPVVTYKLPKGLGAIPYRDTGAPTVVVAESVYGRASEKLSFLGGCVTSCFGGWLREQFFDMLPDRRFIH